MATATKKKKDIVVWEKTADLLQYLNPDNPQDHFEQDIRDTAWSLLEAGWAEIGVSRQKGGYLLGGHGRVQAADWLSKQELEWFEKQWDLWLKRIDGRDKIAADNIDRFCPEYWLECPVKYNNLDEETQHATMIRLNDTQMDGRANQSKIASLMSGMSKKSIEQAGWNPQIAETFMSSYIKKKVEKQVIEAEAEEGATGSDYESKEYFQRPDATDYSGHGDDSPDDATEFSGEVRSYYEGGEDDDYGSEEGDDEDGGYERATERPLDNGDALVEVDDSIGDFKVDRVGYDSDKGETRAVLHMSKAALGDYKRVAKDAAARLGIDTVSEATDKWRAKVVVAALQFVVDHLPAPVEPEAGETEAE